MKKVIAISTTLAFLVSAVPALAFEHGHGHHSAPVVSNDVTVVNRNSAVVENSVMTEANTGYNNANGGKAKGGKATGGNGGGIHTGDAWAESNVLNAVNNNATDIDRCGCSGNGDVTVVNSNEALVGNGVGTGSNTGDNNANGGKAKAKSESSHRRHHSSDPAVATGGKGGEIGTGDAGAESNVVNVVNTNLTRVH